MRRRAAVEPVIGHLKAEHRMERNYLKGLRSNRPKARATAPTPSSPPPATTSRCSSDGSSPFACPDPEPPPNRPRPSIPVRIRQRKFFTDDKFLVSNCSWKNGELTVDLLQSFDLLMEFANPAPLEPAAGGEKSGQFENWRPLGESNPCFRRERPAS